MKSRSRFLACCTLCAVLPLATVEACGPFFSPDVFVHMDHPGNIHAFAEGKLGILQTGYDSNDYAAAYRYLNGGRLSAQEQKIYAPPPQPVVDWTKLTPAELRKTQAAFQKAAKEAEPEYPWLQALAEYVPTGQPLDDYRMALQKWASSAIYYDPNYQNCPRPAFQMAALTLTSRVRTWGRQSPWLADWVHGQQVVFSNCPMAQAELPAQAPAGAPALLRADRAYQTAAAEFYAGNYDQARQSFEAIALDHSSPWHVWGDYLAARAEVRAALAVARKTNSAGANSGSAGTASFDMPTMRRAQQMLETLLADHDPGLPRRAIVQELDFVRIRTEPGKRMAEISAALAGPAPDPNFAQDLKDLSYLLGKHTPIPGSSPIYASTLYGWIQAIRSPHPDDALEVWKQHPSLPWLVAALMRTTPTNPAVPELLKAAALVHPHSPAWQTVMYHRIRLLTARGRQDEARALLEGFLPAMRKQPADSVLNAFLGERMALARTFDEFLQFAPRTVLEENSEGAFYQQQSCPTKPGSHGPTAELCVPSHPLKFDRDAADVLNRAPLTMLIEAAQSSRLPEDLREEIAAAAWTRSVVLADQASAVKLAPLLPKTLHVTAAGGVGFPAILILLRNPGLRPYVEPGLSHLKRPGNLDLYRSNWWCDDWSGQFRRIATPPPAPIFFTRQQAQTGASQYEQVLALPPAPQFLGGEVLAYAKTHSADSRLPEALALTVRATHYACLSWSARGLDYLQASAAEQRAKRENTAVSKAAFEMLHRQFPDSPWTARTKFYY